MIPSNLCYVPPSVDFLGPTTPPVFKSRFSTPSVFKPGPMTPQFSNQNGSSGSECKHATSYWHPTETMVLGPLSKLNILWSYLLSLIGLTGNNPDGLRCTRYKKCL